ncbi:hypothetical protein [Kribbella sp. NPDC048928]|uniref:DUF7683 domain-containing protein n=1 Tax=Kribbella sp. NPDC048928 TaxID=3364111 RepID=UPI00371676BE
MKPDSSDWIIEVFSDETEWLIDRIQVDGLLAREVREMLNLPEQEDIRHGAYPLEGEALRRVAMRAGYRPVAGASFFLAYEGDGTLI